MSTTQISDLPLIDEAAATGEVAELYDEIKQSLQIPFVPLIDQALASSPVALRAANTMLITSLQRSTLPMPLIAMILYSIASATNCEYCSSFHKTTCRTVGVDEDMLEAIESNLDALTPERVQLIVKFALKSAKYPQELTREDYDSVREQGVSDEEIVEIIQLGALAVYFDILSDSLKVEVDPMIRQALDAA